eukprot:scaffold149_cov315-Pinguiococcus_pyrenoidosus.AAC.116
MECRIWRSGRMQTSGGTTRKLGARQVSTFALLCFASTVDSVLQLFLLVLACLQLGCRAFHEGSRVLHIDLAKRNRVLVYAPLSANTLAKLSLGLCDNLVTCLARAWDWNQNGSFSSMSSLGSSRSEGWEKPVVVEANEKPMLIKGGSNSEVIPPPAKPVILAPAMNTIMWQQNITVAHLNTLREWGAEVRRLRDRCKAT